ncbi:MAG TPA: bifunctional nuclease family protein [Aggregicoccus sp.]|nr:bifunctional nuclease family protein [Aggregicoccus sp.]
MKAPLPSGLALAPLTAVAAALGALLLQPALGSSHASEREPLVAAAPPTCVPARGADPKTCTELIELTVRDVVPLREAQTHAVVLSTRDGATVLPIFVDEGAAVAIAFRLAHRNPPHPLSQDLLASVVQQLGGRVTEVRIDDLRNDIYTGRLLIQQGGRKVSIDARPSDSIALALGGKARILVTRKVLTEAGIARGEIDSLRQGPGVGGSGPALPDPVTSGARDTTIDL